MDESTLHDRLRRIKHRQYLILLLLFGLCFFVLGRLIGFWIAGLLGGAFALVVIAAFVVSRRRNRTEPQ